MKFDFPGVSAETQSRSRAARKLGGAVNLTYNAQIVEVNARPPVWSRVLAL